ATTLGDCRPGQVGQFQDAGYGRPYPTGKGAAAVKGGFQQQRSDAPFAKGMDQAHSKVVSVVAPTGQNQADLMTPLRRMDEAEVGLPDGFGQVLGFGDGKDAFSIIFSKGMLLFLPPNFY